MNVHKRSDMRCKELCQIIIMTQMQDTLKRFLSICRVGKYIFLYGQSFFAFWQFESVNDLNDLFYTISLNKQYF